MSAVLAGTLLGMVSGALSYRKLHSFFEARLEAFNALFGVSWRKAPSYTGLREILRNLDSEVLEQALREHAKALHDGGGRSETASARVVAMDGKVLRGSFDHFEDQKAAQILSAFAVDGALILGCLQIDEKSNEIPAVQQLLEELTLTGCLVAVDALHCQKNFQSG